MAKPKGRRKNSFHYPYRSGRPAIFISLPNRRHLREYADSLARTIKRRYPRLDVQSYMGLRQGDWRAQLMHNIMLCNGVIAFMEGLNSNVLFEVGAAMGMGKPIIPVVPQSVKLPSMISHHQAVPYLGRKPQRDATRRILDALDDSVFRSLRREQIDERTQLQQNLLIGGAARRRSSGIKHSTPARSAKDQAALDDAESCYRLGSLEEAIDVLERRVQAGSVDEGVHHILADTWFLCGEKARNALTAKSCYRQFLQRAERGLKHHPRSFALRKDRALAKAKLGRLKEAEQEFRKLPRGRDDALIDYNLACIYAQINQRFLALDYLERALSAREYYRKLAWVDPDFDSVWHDTMFQALVFRP